MHRVGRAFPARHADWSGSRSRKPRAGRGREGMPCGQRTADPIRPPGAPEAGPGVVLPGGALTALSAPPRAGRRPEGWLRGREPFPREVTLTALCVRACRTRAPAHESATHEPGRWTGRGRRWRTLGPLRFLPSSHLEQVLSVSSSEKSLKVPVPCGVGDTHPCDSVVSGRRESAGDSVQEGWRPHLLAALTCPGAGAAGLEAGRGAGPSHVVAPGRAGSGGQKRRWSSPVGLVSQLENQSRSRRSAHDWTC